MATAQGGGGVEEGMAGGGAEVEGFRVGGDEEFEEFGSVPGDVEHILGREAGDGGLVAEEEVEDLFADGRALRAGVFGGEEELVEFGDRGGVVAVGVGALGEEEFGDGDLVGDEGEVEETVGFVVEGVDGGVAEEGFDLLEVAGFDGEADCRGVVGGEIAATVPFAGGEHADLGGEGRVSGDGVDPGFPP